MPSGGSREAAGRKPKWKDDKPLRVSLPQSLSYGFLPVLEDLWEQGYRDQALTAALRSINFRKVKKFDNPVSAGAHSTSSVGADSMNTNSEEIDLFEVLIGDPEQTFITPVTGDSMVGIGIYPGDWLIVDAQHKDSPKEGDIVVVAIDDEVMVKRFHREKKQIVLLSENVEHPPIKRTEGSITINGIVKNSIRNNLSKTQHK